MARLVARSTSIFGAALSLTLTLGAIHPARAATIDWVDFSPYVVGAQSQSGLTSADGLKVDASFSNLAIFSIPFLRSPLPRRLQRRYADASWPFQNVTVPPSLSAIPTNPFTIATTLTFAFTNAGGCLLGAPSRSWISRIPPRR